jgi:hypothetical protein
MVNRKVTGGFLGWVFLLGVTSCSTGGLEPQPVTGAREGPISEHEAIWAASAPDAYVVRVCTQGFSQYECTQEAVAGGRVIASKRWAYSETSYGWTPLVAAERPEPIAALFDEARYVPQEARDCRPNDVTFDDQYGYVTSYTHLCFESWGKRVECFEAAATDLEACGEPHRAPRALDSE